jgi:hypothetical protein
LPFNTADRFATLAIGAVIEEMLGSSILCIM